MKNKKLATLVALPLALTFTLGLSACSTPADPAKAPVSREQPVEKAVDAVAVKANAVATMTSLQGVFLEPETAKFLIDTSNDPEIVSAEEFDPDGKIWEKVKPFAGLPTDDAGLVKAVFGDNPEEGDDAAAAKGTVVAMLAGEFLEFLPEYDSRLDLDFANKQSYELTSFKILDEGTILPQNPAMVIKDKHGAIIDAEQGSSDLKFSKDGTKVIPDFSNKYENTISSLNSDVLYAAKEIEEYLYTVKKGDSPKIADLEKHLKGVEGFDDGTVMNYTLDEKNATYVITMKNDGASVVYDSDDGGVVEENYPLNLLSETMRAVGELNENLVGSIVDGKYAEVSGNQIGEDSKEIAKIMSASKVSDDRKTLVATLDGVEFTFAIPQ